MKPSREEAWRLLSAYTTSRSLIKHGLAVEAAMRAYACKFGEDQEKWGIVGLLHDFDYEQHPRPEEHPLVGCHILEQQGYPEDVIYAIKSHAEYLDLERKSLMDKTLFAVDELCGFITAATLVRPGKKIAEVPVRSVKKKLKDKAFARTVNRQDILQGTAEMGIDLDDHIDFVIKAMTQIGEDLGLA